ncbi:MAG: hypothetical protein MJ129_06435 [Clostridia bacterium]|nr:hypothetical protein [Clostridia bacterium]
MRNLYLVLRMRADEMFGLSTTRYETNGKKKTFSILHKVIMALVAVILFVAIFVASKLLAANGFATILPTVSYVIASVVTFLMTILQLNDTVSGDEDSEFLLSMPFGIGTVPISMFLTMYLKSLVYTALFEVPMIIPYVSVVGGSTGFWVHWVIGFLATCLPISGIAALIGMTIALILSSSSRNNQIQSTIYLVVSAGAVALVFNLVRKIGHVFVDGIGQDPADLSANIVKELCVNYNFARLYQLGVVEMTNVYTFLFVLLSVIWYLFFLGLLTVSYKEFIIALRCPITYQDYEFKALEAKDMEKALFKRELEQFLRSKSYLVSSLVGPIVATVIGIFLAVIGGEEFFTRFGAATVAAGIKNALPAIICFVVALGCTSYCAMSIEGKRHWIMETMPMDERIIEKSKIKVSLLVTVPTAIITSILFVIAFRPNVIIAIATVILPLAYAVLTSWWGIKMDSKYADYSSEDERQAMRHGTSFLFAYLPSVVIPLVIAAVIIAVA